MLFNELLSLRKMRRNVERGCLSKELRQIDWRNVGEPRRRALASNLFPAAACPHGLCRCGTLCRIFFF
jgi:hypothetical protein